MSCHLSMNLMELVVFEIYALTTQLDFCDNCQKKSKLPWEQIFAENALLLSRR
jgi:hypothetical protein